MTYLIIKIYIENIQFMHAYTRVATSITDILTYTNLYLYPAVSCGFPGNLRPTILAIAMYSYNNLLLT